MLAAFQPYAFLGDMALVQRCADPSNPLQCADREAGAPTVDVLRIRGDEYNQFTVETELSGIPTTPRPTVLADTSSVVQEVCSSPHQTKCSHCPSSPVVLDAIAECPRRRGV